MLPELDCFLSILQNRQNINLSHSTWNSVEQSSYKLGMRSAAETMLYTKTPPMTPPSTYD